MFVSLLLGDTEYRFRRFNQFQSQVYVIRVCSRGRTKEEEGAMIFKLQIESRRQDTNNNNIRRKRRRKTLRVYCPS